jgi:prepilin-type processing-associated H-X9-DG protein
MGVTATNSLNGATNPTSGFGGALQGHIGRQKVSDLSSTQPLTQSPNGMDWVGRTHGTGAWATTRTNFVYVDGHVEMKLLKDTIQPWQWGTKVYSLLPGDDLKN